MKEKLKEVFPSVAPIVAIVLILSVSVVPMSGNELSSFLIGAVLLILGMAIFMLGADMSMLPMGEMVGSSLTKSKKLSMVIIFGFIIGFFVTIAEPDVQVLAHQFTAVSDLTLILFIAGGVGLFLVMGLLRTILAISLQKLLIILYGILFLIAAFVPPEFLAISFDSGGVTTGPITVPFILALGVGVSSVRSGENSKGDSFGLVAVCSIGPVLTMLIMGLILSNADNINTSTEIAKNSGIISLLLHSLKEYAGEVVFALLPMGIIFLIFNFKYIRLGNTALLRVLVGFVYTFIGLTLFLTGVNTGFLPAGNFIGGEMVLAHSKYWLIPLGMVLGAAVVIAEPAVHVLTHEVESVSGGTIRRKSMLFALSGGISISVGIAMLRVITGLSLWWFIIPIYALALLLTFFVPKIFTAIAFDSGGVASGAMTATFLVPLATGASKALGGNVLADAFGLVTMVAATPLIAIQLLGVIYGKKLKEEAAAEEAAAVMSAQQEDDILDL
ncbi:MAG: DUF1538 domain-containing protein [Oscillospiraceae bacterium]|nr:DUF1538 domain-containing protein [Oscillospiraceae bacterium]